MSSFESSMTPSHRLLRAPCPVHPVHLTSPCQCTSQTKKINGAASSALPRATWLSSAQGTLHSGTASESVSLSVFRLFVPVPISTSVPRHGGLAQPETALATWPQIQWGSGFCNLTELGWLTGQQLAPLPLRSQRELHTQRVGRVEEGISSNRPELVALRECLEAHQWGRSQRYHHKTAKKSQSRCSNPADQGQGHRGDPLNKEADIRAEMGRLKEESEKTWNAQTERTIYQWSAPYKPNKGILITKTSA
jgi:hypothetical protein